nr:unnamed protein product [Callosobruchus analis]
MSGVTAVDGLPIRGRSWNSAEPPSDDLTLCAQQLTAQIRPSLVYCSQMWVCAPKHSLNLLDSIRRNDAPNLTKDLHILEHGSYEMNYRGILPMASTCSDSGQAIDNEKQMMQKANESEEAQTTLSEEANRLTKQYELLLEDHLAEEKVARSKRYKTETQLQNWVTKFDQDIGDKQAEYDLLQKE